MKSLLLTLIIYSVSCIETFSQTNNPYNDRGIEIKNSALLILDEIKSGNINGYDNETIEKNSDKLPRRSIVTVEIISNTINASNNGNYNFDQLLDSFNLSLDVKNSILEIIVNAKSLPTQQFQNYLTNKVTDILNSGLPSNDKENILTVCSALYHLSSVNLNPEPYPSPDLNNKFVLNEIICQATANGQTGPAPCGLLGAAVGFGFGYAACGIWCGIGGAVIGFIVGVSLK